MKNDFNKFTKNDLPFDTYTDLPIQTYEEIQKNDNEKNLRKKEKKLKREQKLKEQVEKNINFNSSEPSINQRELKTRLKSENVDLQELEELNELNIRNYRHRSRRNRVIIITLVILLLITMISIGIYAGMVYLQNNCFLYTHGDCRASYIVDGMELKRFRTPNNLQGNRVLRADFDIKLESSGSYDVRFTIEVYQSDKLLNNILIYEPNKDLFYDGHDGYFYSRAPISGRQTIDLCLGVILDIEYEDTLNVDNFRLEFHTYFDRA